MTAQHSPLPFALKQGQGFEWLASRDGWKIFELGLVDNPKDLVFIVQACNSFYTNQEIIKELLEACKAGVEALKVVEDVYGIASTKFDSYTTQLQIAIAKAERKG